jgi:hypothetical protein
MSGRYTEAVYGGGMSNADQALADRTITFLNELLQADPKVVSDLIETRFPCNEALANHPSVQVQAREGGEPGFVVGLLGILNGLVGADDDGWGLICVVIDDKTKVIQEFKRTPPRAKRLI